MASPMDIWNEWMKWMFHSSDTLGEKYFYYPHFTIRKQRELISFWTKFYFETNETVAELFLQALGFKIWALNHHGWMNGWMRNAFHSMAEELTWKSPSFILQRQLWCQVIINPNSLMFLTFKRPLLLPLSFLPLPPYLPAVSLSSPKLSGKMFELIYWSAI